MRTRFFAGFLLLIAFTGAASAAVILEKSSRQLPYVEVFGCQGVNAFIFRGPTGTSRRAILVPPREYWTAPEAGLYKFVVRYSSGNVSSRLVTPEAFARYQVGDHFYDRPALRDHQYPSQDSKATEAAVRHRHTIAQVWHPSEKPKMRRTAAKHRKHQRSKSHRNAPR